MSLGLFSKVMSPSRGIFSKSGAQKGAMSPAMSSSSQIAGQSPRSMEAATVGTSCGSKPMRCAQSRSAAQGEGEAMSAPMCRGLPCVGPLPSMQSTASTSVSRGAKNSLRSTSMEQKSAVRG